MNIRIDLTSVLFLTLLHFVPQNEAKLVPEYNLKNIDDFEVIKDEYKILYKEHLYSLKEKIDLFVNNNEIILYETYVRLSDMLNNTKIDASGEFVSIKYRLLKQLADNRDDLMQVYTNIRYRLNDIAFKIISYIENNVIDKQTLYVLELTFDQALRKLRAAVPHNKHQNVLASLKTLPYMFLYQGDVTS